MAASQPHQGFRHVAIPFHVEVHLQPFQIGWQQVLAGKQSVYIVMCLRFGSSGP